MTAGPSRDCANQATRKPGDQVTVNQVTEATLTKIAPVGEARHGVIGDRYHFPLSNGCQTCTSPLEFHGRRSWHLGK
jgi:hypothetical protein